MKMVAINPTSASSINIARTALQDISLALNPIKFARLLLGNDPDDWQKELLLSNEKRIILNCSRQSGKSTITAILALHHALNNPGSLVLVISPSYRQSTELFRKIAEFYQDLGRPVPSDAENKHTLELSNKSRIISLPGKEQTIRGFSGPSLIVVDEAARVPDELYYGAARPMLAVSQGRIILLSTPFGKRGFFFKEWSESAAWKKIKITAYECPRITPEFLEEERIALGEWFYNQEFCCEFGENIDAYFTDREIQDSISADVKPLFGPDGKLNRERWGTQS